MKAIHKLCALALTLAVTVSSALAAPTVHGYSEGLGKATENGLWGFVNTTGAVVVPIQYESVLDFSLGTALVRRNSKMGVIRQDGYELISPAYDTLQDMGYGLYLAQKGDYWGVVSLLPFPSTAGGSTQEFYPITYDSAAISQADGLSVLALVKDGVSTVIPLSSLPDLMVARQVPSAQFPLVKGRVPAFSDVGNRDWFTLWVDVAYNVSLMEGVGNGRFAPNQTLTVAEALKLAAYMESRATGDDFHQRPITGTPWYRSSVTYCEARGIIAQGEFDSYERPITRAEMAKVLAATALGKSLPEINSLGQVKASLPDVKAGDYAADAIYGLYAKGILSGTDGKLTFNPAGQLTRAEAAAIVARMSRTEQRIQLWPAAVSYRSSAPQIETAPDQP